MMYQLLLSIDSENNAEVRSVFPLPHHNPAEFCRQRVVRAASSGQNCSDEKSPGQLHLLRAERQTYVY